MLGDIYMNSKKQKKCKLLLWTSSAFIEDVMAIIIDENKEFFDLSGQNQIIVTLRTKFNINTSYKSNVFKEVIKLDEATKTIL